MNQTLMALECSAVLALAVMPCIKQAWNKLQAMPILHSSQAEVDVQQ